MDRLRRASLPTLGDRIRFSARMTAIDQTPDEVIVYYRTPAGRAQARGDYAIITIPFSVLRRVEILKPFSRAKQRAIRRLHYDASGKIFFQVPRRFWEEDDGIFGGARSARRSGSSGRWRTWPISTRRSWRRSSSARRRCGTRTSSPAGPSPSLIAAGRRCCTSTSSPPKDASTLPGSTPPWRTPGSRARSSPGWAAAEVHQASREQA